MAAKKVVTIWTKYLMQQKDLIGSFQKMVQLISGSIKGRNVTKTVESAKKLPNPVFSRVHILLMVAQNSITVNSIF